ncbi:hypothetical protein PCH_Pc24g02110 [Penicillium rubens Wisconsin 54-1255]|uniref:Uncharacterized protein n=1 Tax=Penicillium rubens (strain ATCC 28089 / DSM 1075 / NRRL 1951 / Wisconsin 54-1255) TaxID=500485 RepID=B6HWZ3_PENRW|nr:hypothetical protein PCH_Pc24g02110 [Penicillium rubens Wisconsin 54-1255]
MVFANSASAWIGNACIRTNRVHHNTFDSPHDAGSCMPEVILGWTCANSLIVCRGTLICQEARQNISIPVPFSSSGKTPNVIRRQRGSRIRYQQPTPLEDKSNDDLIRRINREKEAEGSSSRQDICSRGIRLE